MTRIHTVIFDWAGTTVDFGSLSPVSAFREAFRREGIEVTEEETRAPMGMLKIDHIRTMLAMPAVAERWAKAHGGRKPEEVDVQAVYARFEPSLMAVLDQHCDLKPGLLEAQAALRARGIAIGSTTGFTNHMMEVVRSEAEKAGYQPDVVLTAEAVGGFGRPFPYMIFENMRRLQTPSVRAALKVGDTVSDMKEARSAGVRAVGVLEGSSVMGLSREEWCALDEAGREAARTQAAQTFWAAGADFVIANLYELPALIEAVEAREAQMS